jgi:hypothetical protein
MYKEKDISFFGKISSNEAIKFADTPFDFVFYLDTPNPMIFLPIGIEPCKVPVSPVLGDGHRI